MGTVAGVDHGGTGESGDGPGQSGCLVADDDVVGAHRLEGFDGFPNGLAFGDGGAGHVEIGDIGGKTFRGDLERGMGARAGFVEKHQHRLALERRDFLHRAGEELLERRGLIEQQVDFLAVKRDDVEKVFTGHPGLRLGFLLRREEVWHQRLAFRHPQAASSEQSARAEVRAWWARFPGTRRAPAWCVPSIQE